MNGQSRNTRKNNEKRRQSQLSKEKMAKEGVTNVVISQEGNVGRGKINKAQLVAPRFNSRDRKAGRGRIGTKGNNVKKSAADVTPEKNRKVQK